MPSLADVVLSFFGRGDSTAAGTGSNRKTVLPASSVTRRETGRAVTVAPTHVVSQVSPVERLLAGTPAEHRDQAERPRSSGRTIYSVPWHDFEVVVAEVFRRRGYEVQIPAAFGADGGKDLTVRRDGRTRVVQCKHWRRDDKIPVSEIRNFYGVVMAESAADGVFVTTAQFSRDAREFADGKPLLLVDGEQLEQLVTSVTTPGENICDIEHWIENFSAAASIVHPLCPRCRRSMVLRPSRQGSPFWGCSGYPRRCKATRDARLRLTGTRAFLNR